MRACQGIAAAIAIVASDGHAREGRTNAVMEARPRRSGGIHTVRNQSRRTLLTRALTGFLLIVPVSGTSLAADAAAGLALAERWCNSCHIVKREQPGMEAEMPGPHFATMTEYPRERVRAALGSPHPYMPEFKQLGDGDVDDLVAYLRSLQE